MPLQPARKAKDTVSYRPNAHRTENVTVLTAAPAPVTGLAGVAGAAGTLNDAAYIYRVTAIRDTLESAPSAQAGATTTAGVGAGSVALTWNAVPGATSYNVYGRSGTIELLTTVTDPEYVDDGSETPSGALPTAVGEVNLRIPYGVNVTGAEVGTAEGEYVNRYGRAGI